MSRGRHHSTKAWAFNFNISFSDPPFFFFELECSLGPPQLFTDSSSPSVLSLLLILVLPEWDHSFPMTSMLADMLMIPSLQICFFSSVLRIFSTIKRNFKTNVFKLKLLFSHPNPCLSVFSFFSLRCYTCHFNGTSVFALSRKLRSHPRFLLVLHLNIWTIYKTVNSTAEPFLESSFTCLLSLLPQLFPCQVMLWV